MRKTTVALLASAALALLISAGPSRAQTALAGTVTSAEEGAMEGVLVTARRDGASFAVTVVTDAQGRYGFPAAKLEPSPQPSPRPLVLEIEEAQDRIAEQLLKNGDKKSISVTSIEIGGAKLLLSSWEVAAFVEGGDQLSDALQRAVAARAILVEVIAACRKQPAGRASAGSDEAAALEKVIAAAKAEGATMQTAVEDARNAKNIDAAVNLAATAKRLQASADEARKFLP